MSRSMSRSRSRSRSRRRRRRRSTKWNRRWNTLDVVAEIRACLGRKWKARLNCLRLLSAALWSSMGLVGSPANTGLRHCLQRSPRSPERGVAKISQDRRQKVLDRGSPSRRHSFAVYPLLCLLCLLCRCLDPLRLLLGRSFLHGGCGQTPKPTRTPAAKGRFHPCVVSPASPKQPVAALEASFPAARRRRLAPAKPRCAIPPSGLSDCLLSLFSVISNSLPPRASHVQCWWVALLPTVCLC